MKHQVSQMYSVTEVIGILKIGYVTLLRRINNGDIKALKIGKSWRIPEEEILKLINQCKK